MPNDDSLDLDADIAAHGWVVIRIEEDARGPAFAYSIGLTARFGHPEIIILGLPLDVAHDIINLVGDAVRRGSRYVAGGTYDEFLEGYDVTFRAVPRHQYDAYLGTALRFYDNESFTTLQLVYPTREGVWPWQDGAPESFRNRQPVLADESEPPWASEPAG